MIFDKRRKKWRQEERTKFWYTTQSKMWQILSCNAVTIENNEGFRYDNIKEIDQLELPAKQNFPKVICEGKWRMADDEWNLRAVMNGRNCEHEWHIILPQSRQWCRRRVRVNLALHTRHVFISTSATQGTVSLSNAAVYTLIKLDKTSASKWTFKKQSTLPFRKWNKFET